MWIVSAMILVGGFKHQAVSLLNNVFKLGANNVDLAIDSVEPDCDDNGQMYARTVVQVRVLVDVVDKAQARKSFGAWVGCEVAPMAWRIDGVVSVGDEIGDSVANDAYSKGDAFLITQGETKW